MVQGILRTVIAIAVLPSILWSGWEQRLTLNLDEVPLAMVISSIAEETGLNLVISGEIDGEVTMRLDDVPVATALQAILGSNGYRYIVQGDIVVIRPDAGDSPSELVSEIVRLRYIAAETVQRALLPRLSQRGKVEILNVQSSPGTVGDGYVANRVMITDYESIVAECLPLIEVMDVREKQIVIEARIIETSLDAQEKLGFLWPSRATANIKTAATVTSGTSGENDETRSAGEYDPNNGSWTWGKISVDQLSLVLDFLDQDDNNKLISEPRLTTTENHPAIFEVNTVVPIQTINRFTEGAATSDIVTFQDEEVGISLEVLPRINEGSTITLDVFPRVEEIIGFSGPVDNQKPITTERSVRTQVTVEDGETVVLGGLLKEDELETVTRVPVLGHIPILGSLLFTNRSTTRSTSDLIILITPRIAE